MPRGQHRRLTVVLPAALMVGLVVPPIASGACGGNLTLGALNDCAGFTRLTSSFNGSLFSIANTNAGTAANAFTATASSAASAVRGNNTAGGIGVRGSSPSGTGVVGEHTATAGTAPGVVGTTASKSPDAYGVVGRLTTTAPGLRSAAVRGQNAGTNANGSGVFGSHAGSGTGVRGTSVGGTGLLGLHSGTAGAAPGVQGETSATTGSAAGVVGKVVPTSPGGFSAGVRGINNGIGGLGIGVWGSHNGGGWGVYGESKSGTAVNAESGTGVGVAASVEGTQPALEATNTGGGPAAAFSAEGTPFTVNSSTKVDDLNADQLDGRSANELARTAVAAVLSYNTSGTFAEQAKIIIDAPTDGLMLVSGAVSIGSLIGGDTSCDPCTGVMRLRDLINEGKSSEQVGTFGNGSSEESAQLANSWVFPVTAGRREFALETAVENASAEIFSDNPTLTALFVPFGPSGVRTTGAVSTETVKAR